MGGNALLGVVATVVHDIRVGVYYQTYVLGRLELLFQVFHQRRSCLEISLGRHDIIGDVLDSAVRSLFVLLFVLLVQFLDVALADLYQTIGYGEVRLHNIICTHTVLTTVECKFSIQRVRLDQVLQQVGVFLLHITDADGFLPVQPIGLVLLEHRVLLGVVAFLVDGLQQTYY